KPSRALRSSADFDFSKREQYAMRSNISRRLRQLEQRAHIHDPPRPLIFVRFVSPRGPGQSSRAECHDQVWERTPREKQQDFERRVRKDLKRHEDRPIVVAFYPGLTDTDERCISDIPPNRS